MKEQIALRKMLVELLEVEEGLSLWEMNFLDSLNEWAGNFTEKQATTLEKIWNRVLE